MLHGAINALSRFTRRVNRLFLVVAVVLLVALLIVMVYDLTARNVFDSPTDWALDVSRFLLIFIFFLTVAPTLERGGHVAVDVLERYLSPRMNTALAFLAHTLTLVFGAFLLWEITKATADAFRYDEMFPTFVPLKQKYVYWVAPLGMVQFLLTGLSLLGTRVWSPDAAFEHKR